MSDQISNAQTSGIFGWKMSDVRLLFQALHYVAGSFVNQSPTRNIYEILNF